MTPRAGDVLGAVLGLLGRFPDDLARILKCRWEIAENSVYALPLECKIGAQVVDSPVERFEVARDTPAEEEEIHHDCGDGRPQ